MPRDRDVDTASSSGQSKRTSATQIESDSLSDAATSHQPPRPKQQQSSHHHHHKQHHVGRFHARVPSTKALHKHHGPPGAKLTRRITSPHTEVDVESRTQNQPRTPTIHSHRRATSEVKLPRQTSSANISKSASHSSLKRNRSHTEVTKQSRSSDKLKRLSNDGSQQIHHHNKGQVHFDLGNDDDQEDEWVDASGSNSPYLSRKGSINSAQSSSLRPATNVKEPKPETPDSSPSQDISPAELERLQHKEYLTSRLLQRTPSHGAPPQMSTDMASALPPKMSPDLTDREPSTLPNSARDELTSRFVEAPGSGLTSEGSFFRHAAGDSVRSEGIPRRPRSMISFSQAQDSGDVTPHGDGDNSALIPKPARRVAAPPAETSRTQQKLNLQRASSVIEPGQSVASVGAGIGVNPLIGVGGPGYDGGSSRDPRVGKLLERTGMEYLVVRRYQNPVARSLNRLTHLPGTDKSKRIPRINTGSVSSKRSLDLTTRHTRNVSLPEARRPTTPKRPASIRTNGAGSSYEEDMNRLNERLSGSSLVGGEEEDGTAALLRSLWDKAPELSGSAD